MTHSFNYALEAVLKWEGGYSDHKLDPGGATNLGITHKTLARWREGSVTKEDVKNLTKQEASDIYYSEYWLVASCDEIPQKVAICVFDSAVNQGPTTAKKLLQKTIRTKADGIIGPKTLQSIATWDEDKLLYSYMAKRGLRYSKLAIFSVFGYGWFRRIFDIYGKAILYKE